MERVDDTAPAASDDWPEHFGEGCPPGSARQLDREIFYLVSTPPAAADFECAIDRGSFVKVPRCLRAGLSCAVESASLERKRESVPRLRDCVVASARLEPIHGQYEQTTNNKDHYTMWLRRAALVMAPSLFTLAGTAR